ncbi:MAG: hypothetical protein KHW49_07620 [Eubacterium sp.]|nr:hypothetical protein [Eubacterium sp.]MBS6315484.1 hypothetical protein [Ruminococcus sp.]
MQEPDFDTIYSMLLKLRDDFTLRNEVAEWAQQYVENYDLEINDENSWELLLSLSMLDTQYRENEYLYGKKTIENLISKYSNKDNFFK